MIRYLDEEEKKRCRGLWEEAFPEDSKSFDDYYFDDKLSGSQVLVREENGRLVSMLHRNPYQVQMPERCYRVDYIVGVATAKDCRHRGYMKSLLERMAADMYRERMPFCFLMPADQAIYLPFGFAYIFDQPQFVWRDGKVLKRHTLREDPDACNRAADWINAWLGERYQVYAKRTPEYMAQLCREMRSENGGIDEVYEQDRLIGYDGEWGWEKKELRLRYGSAADTQMIAGKPAIMGRIIFLPEFLRQMRSADGSSFSVCLQLTDEMIPENDGRWLWHIGPKQSEGNRCTEEAWNRTQQAGAVSVELSIADLTQWLFGYRVPEAAMAYADRIRTIQGVFLDEVV